MHRIQATALAAAFLALPLTQAFAETGDTSGSIVQQKLEMEIAGFEKDTVLRDITYRDAARLDAFETIRGRAVAEARPKGAAADLAVLDEIGARPTQSFEGLDLTGEWQCRTIKVGGLASLVVYDWFDCRVTDDGSGWFLEKTGGSQRTAGRFFNDGDNRQIYLGSFFVAGDARPSYGTGRETDQVGYALRDGEQSWRIEFPAPAYESKFDILEFRRKP